MRFPRFSLWSIVVPAVLAGGAGYGLMGQKPEAAGESPVPPMALTSPAIPKLKEGNPWEFYARGDWRNAVFNFGRATGAKARYDAGTGSVEMGRGVAAFKAATADPARFDDTQMETAIEAFGAALATGDAALREDAHYNLANAIFERAKSTEKQRALAESKAKSRKAQKRHAVTLKYLDGLIRRLENCLEHYQETMLLNAGRSDAQTNHNTVLELVRRLREIRIQQVRTGEMLKKKKKMKCEGKCEGECDGECEGSGMGKGSGDSEEEGEADENGEGEDKVQDESNREFKGTPRTAGDPGEAEEGDREDEIGDPEDVDPHSDGETRRNEIIRRLKNLSQELPVRERHKIAPEDRPPNDW